MTRKELFKSLNELCRDLDDKYNINAGGCCFIAAIIAEQMELHHISYTIVHYDICGCHYAIRVNDRIINRGNYKKKEIIEEEYISSDDLYHIYYDRIWNDCYNTDNNLQIKNKIISLFNKYGNCI